MSWLFRCGDRVTFNEFRRHATWLAGVDGHAHPAGMATQQRHAIGRTQDLVATHHADALVVVDDPGTDLQRIVLECRRQVIQFGVARSEEHTSELQSRENLVCRLLLEKKKNKR